MHAIKASQESDERIRVVSREDPADLQILQCRRHDLNRLRCIAIELSRDPLQWLMLKQDLSVQPCCSALHIGGDGLRGPLIVCDPHLLACDEAHEFRWEVSV